MASALAAAPGVMFQQREAFNPAGYGLGGVLTEGYCNAEDFGPDEIRDRYRFVLSGRSGIGSRRQRLRCLAPRRPRLILKDPLASFSLEWLTRNFDLDVVVMVRHPCAFAWSLKRMDWDMDFGALLRQPRLMEDHLSTFVDDLRSPPGDIVARAGLMWSCINSVLAEEFERHPQWRWRRHEDVATRPLEELSRLYADLGLRWTSEAEAAVRSMTHGSEDEAPKGQVHALVRDSHRVPEVWKKRLTTSEIATVREWAEPTASIFYDEASWQ